MEELPDVTSQRYDETQLTAIYGLYEAGILNGVDQKDTFAGTVPLTSGQAAIMLARVLDPQQRLMF